MGIDYKKEGQMQYEKELEKLRINFVQDRRARIEVNKQKIEELEKQIDNVEKEVTAISMVGYDSPRGANTSIS